MEQSIEKIKASLPLSSDPKVPHFTLVFDREAYEPLWFIKRWKEYRVAVITYRKNVRDKRAEDLFKSAEIQLSYNTVTMQLCETGSCIQNRWFREIRKLSAKGHLTSIITTHPALEASYVAMRMFSRWTQENFFKYMSENFDFDRMMEYGSMALQNKCLSIPNPAYKQVNYRLKKAREKKARLRCRRWRCL
jgi:hypothetical protein